MKTTSIGIAILLLGIDCHAAGFDCNKASTFIEKAICKDVELSNLDSELMNSYKSALKNTSSPDQLKSEQKSWIKNVRNTCQDPSCLKKVYHERIFTLKQQPSNSANNEPPKIFKSYSYSEKGYRGTMEISEISGCEVYPNKLGCISETLLKANITTIQMENLHTCEMDAVENPYARITSGSQVQVTFIQKNSDSEKNDNEDNENYIRVVFSNKGADITEGNFSYFCGLQGSILGHWVPSK